jgi:hypothetical protein
VNFDTQDNWEDHPSYKETKAVWASTNNQTSKDIIYISHVGQSIWLIRMNDFPDEPLYTLFDDGKEILHFNDWPEVWCRPD